MVATVPHWFLAAMNRRRTTSRGTSPTTKISHQPPRLLIVHIAVPSWANICPNLCEALQNFFSIACSLMGPSRMSLFSLYTVQNQHECILPFVVSLSALTASRKQVSFPQQSSQLLLLTVKTTLVPRIHLAHVNQKSSCLYGGVCAAREKSPSC